jgi:hypothetical protein
MGSGSILVAAIMEGCSEAIGIERERHSFEIATCRVEGAQYEPPCPEQLTLAGLGGRETHGG